jgi:energy-coupling factor transporter ATP-binding protein EcfA2
MLRPGGENLSPFADRVARSHGSDESDESFGLHSEVRDRIVRQIAAIHEHQRSEVILLSGEAGAGKTHLLRHFAQSSVAEANGYVFVGGSNDWKVEEFQPCLLDWMISALTSPSPSSNNHILLERIQAIGFRAVGQLLENRTALKRCLAKRKRRYLGRLFGLRRADHETIQKLTKARDPGVFRHLDFARFSEEVCTRFLAEPGNLVHRYALRVLLTYLFPDASDVGLGTRERVLHWFRRKPDDGYWSRRFGVADDLKMRYAVADAIKLLIHLFSPDLSKRLSVDGDECQPRVFLFAFDQAEGRDELFDRLEDWNHFFAHLSELYNTLPNVLILFTMTLGLRNELHPKMERQFKDRIRKDERFVLRQPTPEQIRDLYRARLADWLEGDPLLAGLYSDLEPAEQYLPFGSDRVVEIGRDNSVRATLEAFDAAFHRSMFGLVVEPEYDFEFVRNAEQKEIEKQSEHDYTLEHLETVRNLIGPIAEELAAEYGGVRLTALESESADSLPVLKLTFADPQTPASWVCVYLARFGHVFAPHVARCRELLAHKEKLRYSVWMVRASAFAPKHDRPEQIFHDVVPAQVEARLWAAKHLLDRRAQYEADGTWPAAWELIRREIGECYLGKLFQHAEPRERQESNRPARRILQCLNHRVRSCRPIPLRLSYSARSSAFTPTKR